MRHFSQVSKQQGVVLPVALIMLVMMLLIAIVSFNMGRQNTIIAGNMQHKAEVVSSANQTVEAVISKTTFISNPSRALPGNKATYDVNGDGKNDITVTLSPVPCVKKVQIIKNSELDVVNNVDDRKCASYNPTAPGGIDGMETGNSQCANSVWEINAVAVDNVTGAEATVTTGVGVRIAANNATNPANMCP